MRRFEFSTGESDKFWEIELKDSSFVVKYGRIGGSGLSQEKTFPSAEKAKIEYEKLIAEKLKKGYIEVTGSGGAQPSASLKRSASHLKEELQKFGLNVETFERVPQPDDDEDEEGGRRNRDSDDSFYMIMVPAKEATSIWLRQRAIVDKTGYYPIITEDYDTLFEYMEFNEDPPAQIVNMCGSVDVHKFLEEKLKENMGDDEEDDDDTADDDDEWTDGNGVDNGTFHTVSSASDGEVTMIFCPTKTAWHVPAVLRWGGSNDGIEPFEHTAVLKKWNTEYGAELVCATMDVLELRVEKPPLTKDAAMKLAHEQYAYCPDIVDQGTGSVTRLANELFKSDRWFFWWD